MLLLLTLIYCCYNNLTFKLLVVLFPLILYSHTSSTDTIDSDGDSLSAMAIISERKLKS